MAGFDFNLLTIGAGSGGVAGTRRAAGYGAKTAICEEGRVGGTCVLRGCIPKKLLVYGAHFRDAFEDAAGFGWQVGARDFDWEKLIANKDRELDRLNGIYLRMLEDAGVTLLEGRARLVDAHRVEIGGKSVTAEKILVATGSWPSLPDIPGIEHAITSNEALDLTKLPARMAIVGGGYIAVEFAGIFDRLGVAVIEIIRGEQILRGFDGDVRAALTEEMENSGIEIRANSQVQRIEKKNGHVALHVATKGAGEEILDVDLVMYATGRIPNTSGIGLEEIGIALEPGGAISVNADNQTSLSSVYAVGDCTDRLNLTPVAIAEARAFADTFYGGKPKRADHADVPTAVFSQPPIGTVGYDEVTARAKFGAIDVYFSKFRPMKHTLSGRETKTMVKLVVDHATDRVLGCHMVGEDAPEIVQALAIALKAGARKADFDATMGVHPTAAEEFVTLSLPRSDPKEEN
ncbi:MAG: glutathione-disulfide reductase [Rhodospirillaceae bacterium]|nr:MAG: glutathione-disulfide reductase [Rhodospirillaceae bacterium]